MGQRGLCGFLAAAWLLACASGGGGRDGSGLVQGGSFPGPEELEALRQQPGPQRIFDSGLKDVETWELRGPFPPRVAFEPWTDETPAGRLLAEQAARRSGMVIPTEAMHCVAREMGLFYLEHGARPPDGLRRSIRAMCRSTVSSVRFGFVGGRVPETADDETLLEAWGESVQEALRRQLVGGPLSAGVWLGRAGEQAILMVAAGERTLHLDPLAPPSPNGSLVLEGEVLVPARQIGAAVTHGRLGFSFCQAEGELALPRFRLRCRIDPSDPRAWLALSIHPPGRLVGRMAAELLLWPGEQVDPVYRRPSYVPSQQARDEESVTAGFVALLNQLREAEGLEALVTDEAQSALARDLAPHFFEASVAGMKDDAADRVMLGLLAGWKVEGIVQSAYFTASWALASDDVGRLLSEALDRPLGRHALLADDVQRIAVGPLLEASEESASMAVVVGTYALFPEEVPAGTAEQVFERLGRERGEHGRRAPQRLDGLGELSTAMAAEVQAGRAPREALRELLNGSGELLRRSVRGWALESTRLEDVEFPDELLYEPRVSVSIGVSSYQPEGEAWGRHVVLIVAAEPDRGI